MCRRVLNKACAVGEFAAATGNRALCSSRANESVMAQRLPQGVVTLVGHAVFSPRQGKDRACIAANLIGLFPSVAASVCLQVCFVAKRLQGAHVARFRVG